MADTKPQPTGAAQGLRGVFPMLLTPFDADGRILWADLDRLIEFELEQGVHGIAALGLGGEVGRLSQQERLAIAERVLAVVGGRVPVIIGASAQDTETARRLAGHAAAHGAAAVMVAPVGPPGIEREELRRHYLQVAAAAAPAPLMVQDAPAYVGVALDAEFMVELAAAAANVRYAKPESVPAGERTAKLAHNSSHPFAVFGGHGGLYSLDVLDAGGIGIIPGCECPGELVAIFEAYAAGRRDQAARQYQALLPLLVFEIQTLDFFIACSKELLRRRGVLVSSALRAPWPLAPWSLEALTRHARWAANSTSSVARTSRTPARSPGGGRAA